jgi:hypothetical protein
MISDIARIQKIRKGHEGQGYNYYVVQSQTTHLYADREGHFTVASPYDENVLQFHSEQDARTHALARNWEVEAVEA